jgi:hypothetical protein
MRLNLFVPLLVVCLSGTAAHAQERRRPGSVSSSASIQVITRTINDCENNTDRFVRSLRRALNQSALNGTQREDDLQRLSKDLERSMDRVSRSWKKDKDVSETRGHVRDAIRSAQNINVTMRARRLNPETESDWREVRAQLNLLARAFKLPSISW